MMYWWKKKYQWKETTRETEKQERTIPSISSKCFFTLSCIEESYEFTFIYKNSIQFFRNVFYHCVVETGGVEWMRAINRVVGRDTWEKEAIAAEATKRREPRDDGKSLGRLENYSIKPKSRRNLRAWEFQRVRVDEVVIRTFRRITRRRGDEEEKITTRNSSET